MNAGHIKPDFEAGKLEALLRSVQSRLLARRMLLLSSRNLLLALAAMLPLAVIAVVRAAPASAVPAAAASLAALVAAAIETLLRRPGRIRAAEYLDQRCGLKERLSTYCSAAFDSATPEMKKALADDLFRHTYDISPEQACPLILPRTAPFTGAAIFCTVVLIFGAAQRSVASPSIIVHNELEEMLTGSGSHVELKLPQHLRDELETLIGDGTSKLDDIADRIQDMLGRFEAIKKIAELSETLQLDDLDAADFEELLKNQPEVRERLHAALDDALRKIRDDALREALAEALQLLEAEDDEALADALQGLIEELATQIAEHDVVQLEMLATHLSAARGKPEDGRDEAAIGRYLESGGDPERKGDAAPDILFPQSAIIKAKTAINDGTVHPRYRWIVERYFATDFSATE